MISLPSHHHYVAIVYIKSKHAKTANPMARKWKDKHHTECWDEDPRAVQQKHIISYSWNNCALILFYLINQKFYGLWQQFPRKKSMFIAFYDCLDDFNAALATIIDFFCTWRSEKSINAHIFHFHYLYISCKIF